LSRVHHYLAPRCRLIRLSGTLTSFFHVLVSQPHRSRTTITHEPIAEHIPQDFFPHCGPTLTFSHWAHKRVWAAGPCGLEAADFHLPCALPAPTRGVARCGDGARAVTHGVAELTSGHSLRSRSSADGGEALSCLEGENGAVDGPGLVELHEAIV